MCIENLMFSPLYSVSVYLASFILDFLLSNKGSIAIASNGNNCPVIAEIHLAAHEIVPELFVTVPVNVPFFPVLARYIQIPHPAQKPSFT